jgi:O-methyltransferase domain
MREAMQQAQLLAFSPLFFQAVVVMENRGILAALVGRAVPGATIAELAEETSTSPYGVTVLLEAALGAGVAEKSGDRFRPTRVGLLLARDPLTRANLKFVEDCCYLPAFHLGESIAEGRPAGLKELGPWPTVYEGLAELPPRVRKSWLDFDHFYSDDAFPLLVPQVLARLPKRVLDVGGNTGKFARALLSASPDVRITVADLPGQIASCKAELERAGFASRADYHPLNILRTHAELPGGHDVIWMSQFLSCFSEPEIVHILSLARKALSPAARLFIVDNLWDKQPHEVGSLSLQATSLYFTCVANGNSRMYDSETLLSCISAAGLTLESETHNIGWGHSLLIARS